MKLKWTFLFAVLLLFPFPSSGQLKEHMIGFKGAFNISGINTNPKTETLTVRTKKNISVVYTYYHDLWKNIPNSGFQAAISYEEQGYMLGEQRYDYTLVKLPLVSQFHIDFWKMRLLLNLGCYGGYRLKSSENFAQDDYRIDYGFIAGGGIAFTFKPIELHFEGNYHHSFSHMYSPRRYSETSLVFSNPYQILLSAALYIHL